MRQIETLKSQISDFLNSYTWFCLRLYGNPWYIFVLVLILAPVWSKGVMRLKFEVLVFRHPSCHNPPHTWCTIKLNVHKSVMFLFGVAPAWNTKIPSTHLFTRCDYKMGLEVLHFGYEKYFIFELTRKYFRAEYILYSSWGLL